MKSHQIVLFSKRGLYLFLIISLSLSILSKEIRAQEYTDELGVELAQPLEKIQEVQPIEEISAEELDKYKKMIEMSQGTNIEHVLFDDTFLKLSEAVKESGRRQAIYSYIIANASTPEIDLEGLLMPDDQARYRRVVPEGEDGMVAMVEFVAARMGENSKRQNAYLLLMKKKFDILSKVISKGQK